MMGADELLYLALLSDLAARRGERILPRRPAELGPMDPSDVVEPDELVT